MATSGRAGSTTFVARSAKRPASASAGSWLVPARPKRSHRRTVRKRRPRSSPLLTALAVAGLKIPAEYLLVDAWDVPEAPLPQMAVVRGDRTCASIMAASIVAKVARDKAMVEYDRLYPGYGFADHKGYATPGHRAAIRRLGPSPIHRTTWAPFREPALLG